MFFKVIGKFDKSSNNFHIILNRDSRTCYTRLQKKKIICMMWMIGKEKWMKLWMYNIGKRIEFGIAFASWQL